jgi:uncharacterized damage-inducible protein DinB
VGIDAMLMPVAHAFEQAKEDIAELADHVPPALAWQRPGGAAPVAYHILHAAGSLDRLLTYARGESLSAAQLASLAAEAAPDTSIPLSRIAHEAVEMLERALDQVRRTPRDHLLLAREVGRGRLPSTVIGLLVHAAEHTTRHVGQAITTAKALSGTRPH